MPVSEAGGRLGDSIVVLTVATQDASFYKAPKGKTKPKFREFTLKRTETGMFLFQND